MGAAIAYYFGVLGSYSTLWRKLQKRFHAIIPSPAFPKMLTLEYCRDDPSEFRFRILAVLNGGHNGRWLP